MKKNTKRSGQQELLAKQFSQDGNEYKDNVMDIIDQANGEKSFESIKLTKAPHQEHGDC